MAAVAVLALLLASAQLGAATCQWSYSGSGGVAAPDTWDSVCGGDCARPDTQSPRALDVATTLAHTDSDTPLYGVVLPATPNGNNATLRYDGNLLSLTFATNQWFKIGNVTYTYNTMYFHTPADHVLGSVSDMEVQIYSNEGAALSWVFQQSSSTTNAFISQLESSLASTPSVGAQISVTGLTSLLTRANNSNYYQYSGSKTFPDCKAGVQWYIFSTPEPIGAGQLTKFKVNSAGSQRPTTANTATLFFHQWTATSGNSNGKSPTAAIATVTVFSSIFLIVVFYQIWKRKKGYVSLEFQK